MFRILILMIFFSYISNARTTNQSTLGQIQLLEILPELKNDIVNLDAAEIESIVEVAAVAQKHQNLNVLQQIKIAVRGYSDLKKDPKNKKMFAQVKKSYRQFKQSSEFLGNLELEKIKSAFETRDPIVNFATAIVCEGGIIAGGTEGFFAVLFGKESSTDCYDTTRPKTNDPLNFYQVGKKMVGLGLGVNIAERTLFLCTMTYPKKISYNLGVKGSAGVVFGGAHSGLYIGQNGVCIELGVNVSIGAFLGLGLIQIAPN